MSDLERLIRCAINDLVDIEIVPEQGPSIGSITSYDDCITKLKAAGVATLHFILTTVRRETAYVFMDMDHPILDHTRGGYVEAILYPPR